MFEELIAAAPVAESQKSGSEVIEVAIPDELSVKPPNELKEYYCQICFENHNTVTEGYELSICRHVFCKDCLVSFLRSKIEDGQVHPKCFFMTEIHTRPDPHAPNRTESERKELNVNSPNSSPMKSSSSHLIKDKEIEEENNDNHRPHDHQHQYEVVDQRTIHNHTCNEDISSIDIQLLLREEKELIRKYDRFKFCRENKNARECPSCHAFQLGQPDVSPKMTCQNCATHFCFFHSNAHDFSLFPTCEEYEKSIAKENQSSVDLIQSQSKACPSCGVMVMKSGKRIIIFIGIVSIIIITVSLCSLFFLSSFLLFFPFLPGGCNHMKCQCGAAFCWLCGKQIEDTLFPAHFQWWNPSGCSNLQVNLRENEEK
jgi:hypothetical protein